jgi:competence protein ComEC
MFSWRSLCSFTAVTKKMSYPRKKHYFFAAVLVMLAVSDIFCWFQIFLDRPPFGARAYFLDVGQGDSELVAFANGVTMMTDAGPTNKVIDSLGKALPGKRYIDLALITHPQTDHFNGYNFILDRYDVGAFLYNGRDDPGVAEWMELKNKIAAKHIPFITLGGGDSIHIAGSEVDILSPNAAFAGSAELNDTGLVEMVQTESFRALFTADTGFNIEDWLVANARDLHADILKVPHHGSKYASNDAFLRAVDPAVAVIEVGAKNTYGHPGAATLARIASSTHAAVFRTDQNGTIEIFSENGKLKVARGK